MHLTADQFAFALFEFFVQLIAFSITNLLRDHLFGGLRGNPPKALNDVGFDRHHDHIVQFRIGVNEDRFFERDFGIVVFNFGHDFFFDKNFMLIADNVDFSFNALGAAGTHIAAIRRHQCLTQRLDDRLTGQLAQVCDLIER